MDIQGFVVPVPAQKREECRAIAESFWEIAGDDGAVEHVEAWETDVPDGKRMIFGGFEPLVRKGRG